ncbi:MAG: cob(I)yrinic acid a,c-diamide adenosyltransferase [Endomicrobium sp.]|jgi:cob(I)alamin adenosyltransferase|uniref:cob(I)yrinic acid a,c-diamide adenosyltransferase n=1 Tax=Candidatus Endomicrobiellum cubanum TaxID=3242325 RepID=UPI002839839E|nr:cob(I)yrinic acid a,c-diamide adenosyltransferase [Endomicrobium sp.]
MIIVNTGNGKGKTTAAIGQVVRALGHNFKVCIIQLFKSDIFYGEQGILKNLDGLDFFSFAKEHPYFNHGISLDTVLKQCLEALDKIREILKGNKKYDLIVLEEFNIALRDQFIDINIFLKLLKELSYNSKIIVTGRGAPQQLIEIADLVSEMKEIKHPYNIGSKSQKGIEY